MALLNQRHSKTFVLWIVEFCAVSLLIKLSWVRKIIMLLIFFLLFFTFFLISRLLNCSVAND